MELDPNRIRRAADQVGRALRLTDDLRNAEVPWLLGRGAGTDRLVSIAGDAAEWSRSAEDAIGRLGAGFEDARTALDQLGTVLESGRRDGIRAARRGQLLVSAVDRTRVADVMLDTVQDGIAARGRGELQPFVSGILGQGSPGTGQIDGVRVLADRFRDIGPARPFLRQVRAGGWKEIEHARLALADTDGSGMLQAWRGVLSQQSEASLQPAYLRDVFLEVAAKLPGDPATRVPAWLDEAVGTGEKLRLSPQQSADLWLRSNAATRDDVATIVAQQLAVSPAQMGKGQLGFAASAAELPEDLRVAIPQLEGRPTIAEMLGVSTSGLHTNHKPFVDELYLRLLEDEPVLRAQQVEWLRGVAPQVERTRRLGMIGQAHPEAVLGEAAAAKPWAQELLAQAIDPKLNQSNSLGLDQAFDLARRTGGDRAQLLDELERITRLPASELTAADVATLRGVTWLPAGARPRMSAPLVQDLWTQLGGNRIPTAGSNAYRRLDDVALAVERERMTADPTVTREAVAAELDELLARPAAELTEQDTRRLALLGELPPDKRPYTPWGPDGTVLSELYQKRTSGTGMQAELDHMRLARDAERLAGDSSTTRAALEAELDELLAKPSSQLSIGDVRRIATMAMLPDELRPAQSMVLTRNNLLSTGYVGRPFTDASTAAPFSHNARVELDDLRLDRETTKLLRDPDATPQSVADELAGLLAKPGTELTVADARRILTLSSLPEPLRPVLADEMPTMNIRAAASIGYDVTDPNAVAQLAFYARNELLGLRIANDRQHMLLAGTTANEVEREMRTLLAGGDDLDADQLRRLAVLDGMPEQLRVDAPSYDSVPLAQRIANGQAASNLRRDIASIRLSLEAADDAAANPRTREQLTDELARILIRSNSQLDDEAVHRAAVISRHPLDVRPQLPPYTPQQYDLARVYLDGVRPGSYVTPTDAAREMVIRNSGIGIEELVDTVRTEQGIALDQLAPSLRRLVVTAGTEQLERLGISDRTLLAGALGSARSGSVKGEVEAATREAQAIVANMQPYDEVEAQVLGRLREQLDHSLARIESRIGGGYSNYVDYQNHGGAIANADLLKALDDARRAAGGGQQAEAAGPAAANVLNW